MYIVIVGSGRTGSKLAGLLSEKGNDVVIVDKNNKRFTKLPVEFSGFTVEGDALEQEVLKKTKIDKADLAVVTTGNDKINYMVTKLARVIFNVPSVLVRVVKPDKIDLFKDDSAVETFSPISLLVDEFVKRIDSQELRN